MVGGRAFCDLSSWRISTLALSAGSSAGRSPSYIAGRFQPRYYPAAISGAAGHADQDAGSRAPAGFVCSDERVRLATLVRKTEPVVGPGRGRGDDAER